jgi:hypothetical protein
VIKSQLECLLHDHLLIDAHHLVRHHFHHLDLHMIDLIHHDHQSVDRAHHLEADHAVDRHLDEDEQVG